MHTAHCSCCLGGVCLPRQWCMPRGVFPGGCLLGGCLLGGCLLGVSAHGVCLPRGVCVCLGDVCYSPLWTEWHTGVKTLPCPKFHLPVVKKNIIVFANFDGKSSLLICNSYQFTYMVVLFRYTSNNCAISRDIHLAESPSMTTVCSLLRATKGNSFALHLFGLIHILVEILVR